MGLTAAEKRKGVRPLGLTAAEKRKRVRMWVQVRPTSVWDATFGFKLRQRRARGCELWVKLRPGSAKVQPLGSTAAVKRMGCDLRV